MAALALIAALDRRRAIGRGNALPWRLPADLKHFRTHTLDGTVLMGRRTFEAIGRPLPRRLNLVLSRAGEAPPGTEVVRNLEQARARCAQPWLWVIGGGEVYALALAQAERLVLTWVDTEIANADTWFPDFNASEWQLVSERSHARDEANGYDLHFLDYRRPPT